MHHKPSPLSHLRGLRTRESELFQMCADKVHSFLCYKTILHIVGSQPVVVFINASAIDNILRKAVFIISNNCSATCIDLRREANASTFGYKGSIVSQQLPEILLLKEELRQSGF